MRLNWINAKAPNTFALPKRRYAKSTLVSHNQWDFNRISWVSKESECDNLINFIHFSLAFFLAHITLIQFQFYVLESKQTKNFSGEFVPNVLQNNIAIPMFIDWFKLTSCLCFCLLECCGPTSKVRAWTVLGTFTMPVGRLWKWQKKTNRFLHRESKVIINRYLINYRKFKWKFSTGSERNFMKILGKVSNFFHLRFIYLVARVDLQENVQIPKIIFQWLLTFSDAFIYQQPRQRR